ncbi:MAG: histidine--tRNA ligase [Verrucomicrobiota bacterium]|nr:histidine--tRNA ligase [Verrucomicrobiota bacterium]
MFETLPGFREFYPEACERRNHIFRKWKQVAHTFGFSEYDPPLLEPLELYIEKSGEEIVTQLFNFVDKGGRAVSLRPELTPSLARLVGAKANSIKRPVKWYAIGENFRYEKQQRGRLRSHYQLNCDILGEPGPGADAELIAVCLKSLTTFGLTSQDLVLRLSDRTLWMLYLAALGIEGDKATRVLGVIDKMERETREVVIEKLKPVFNDGAADFLGKIETLTKIRSLEELRAFLVAQTASNTSNSTNKEQIEARLGEWASLLDYLEAYGVRDYVRVDLGIVRGLAYYTGFVFEIFELGANGTEGRALAGGGRYDHLVKKLGYPDMHAVGFGMGDVTLTDILERKKLIPTYVDAPEIFAVIGGATERKAALAGIAALRGAGYRVDYPLREVAFGKQFKLAGQSGARLALIFGTDEVAAGTVKLRDMAGGTEMAVPAEHLVPAVREFFEHGHLHP